MSKIKRHIRKDELNDIFSLYSKQSWLCEKEDSLLELLLLCETSDNKKLIIKLLNDFNYLDKRVLSTYLSLIADYIITDSGFSQDTCQVAAITFDDEADSSQKILDYIKMPLFLKGWDNFKPVNRYGATMKNYIDGRNQIIFIDEFIGSGQTILGRIKQLNNDIREDFDLKFCFIAGMDYGIKKIEELGYEVFCPLRLPKGITESFAEEDVEFSLNNMKGLEEKLAANINGFDLRDYSLGYNGAEALYTLEGNLGNTPNSVFPIFWWPRSFDNLERQTLLTRFERGLK